MNTKVIGDISEAAVIAALLKTGANVLIPFGDRNRYDIVVEADGKFERIQIKTGRERQGNLIFNTRSSTRQKGKRVETAYEGQIEKFAVYHREKDAVYMVPITICSRSKSTLRLDPSKTNKGPKCPDANQFLLGLKMKESNRSVVNGR